ncbi:DUF58 domain-containing protein [Clostridium algidicarnis]|uniref:DUF58 domain-containing protein n=1 Tax=Clostridium algidicarnis TaxID=37659 RepID=UPI001C0BB36B|nr:DUF58 domain-containing protein [Clostridium algidicarnis]MBU3209618.1 DUF58 domain-containing protein [Clostridium algidicarnis]
MKIDRRINKINLKFAFLLLITSIYAYIQGGILSYTILYILLSIFIIAIITCASYYFSIKINVELNEDTFYVKDNIKVKLIVSNKGIFKIPYLIIKGKLFSLNEDKYEGEAMSIPHFGVSEYSYCIKFKVRGNYDLRSFTIFISDIFNIINIKKQIKSEDRIKVYPKIYELEKLMSSKNKFYENAFLKMGLLEDIYSIREMREYREGDNLKRVNWKVSAKANKLVVKNYDALSCKEVMVLLDMNESIYEEDNMGLKEEALIDICISWIMYSLNQNIRVKLYINAKNEEVISVKSKEDFSNLMEFFVENKSDGVREYNKFIASKSNELRNNPIIMITGKVTGSLIKSLSKINKDKNSITVFYLDKEHTKEDFESLSINKISFVDINLMIKDPKGTSF